MSAAGVIEHAMEYPVTTEIPLPAPNTTACWPLSMTTGQPGWRHWPRPTISSSCARGDPLFYGSFMHLHTRLQGLAEVEVIPGIPGMTGCWNVVGRPMTWGDDAMTVLMGTLPEPDLTRHIAATDAVVVMKPAATCPRSPAPSPAPGAWMTHGWSNAAPCRTSA